MNGWTRGQIGDRESLVGLLKRGEWNQMHFSQVLRESHGLRLTQNGAVYLARDGKNGARAALYISRGGALHCCFEPEELRKEDTRIFSRILSERNLFSLIGRKDRIALIEEIYNPAASFSVDYDLMVRQAESDRFDRDENGTDYLIRRAGREDFADLYPLEEAYQKEEVLRNPEALNARFLKKNFMKTLETSYVWALYRKGRAIAKGGTNAVGFSYCQLGGVYTIPEERGKGWGTLLIDRIGGDLNREGWGTSLFVRKKNDPARRLYEKCGYRNRGDFRIVYPSSL